MSASADLTFAVRELTAEIKKNASKRATKALTILRNSALEVLGQDGTGRTYVRGGKKNKKGKKKKPIIHVASAAGEPPAPDYGNLRRNWDKQKILTGDLRITCLLTSRQEYADYLEFGTKKMKARPYREKIREAAIPEIDKLYADL